MTTRTKEKSKEIKFVKLTNDKLFKVTFGRKDNRRFLEDLLESYYGYPKGYLKGKLEVNYELTLDKPNFSEKDNRSDIVVRYDNIFINIEMYSLFNEEAYDKSTFYIMRICTNQLLIGDMYSKIEKVTQINFIEKDMINISENLKSSKMIGTKAKQDFIILDKVPNSTYNDNRFYKYLRLFNANSFEEMEEFAKGDEVLMEIVDWVKAYQGNDDPKFFNDDYWNERIYRLEGKKEGVKERNIEIAKNMLEAGEDEVKISKYTNLSLEQINKLKEENN